MLLDTDVIVAGSGFAGSLTALCLRQMGQRVVLVERGRHPRFAIGESSTPLANLLIEELASRYRLPRVAVFSKWGTWQRERPDVGGGLKRGFSFYFHEPGTRFADTDAHERQLLVAASPHDEIGDTHWYRPDFDHNLVREAEAAGVVYLDAAEIRAVDLGGSRAEVEALKDGRPIRIRGSFLVDASGPRGLLARALELDAPLRWLPPTQGLYTHFEDVARWEHLFPAPGAPYPPDAAALHHVFPGGWIWVLRFANGITSAGAALTDPLAARVGSADGATGWATLLEALPAVQAQFERARPIRPWIASPRLAFRTNRAAGSNWALLPSAAGVIDPLLSTGFPLTLLGVERLLDILGGTSPGPERSEALGRYERATLDELDVTERLVAALYATMADVPLFKRLALLYFAAASFSETARRLGRPELAPGFLLHRQPDFGPALRTCCELALDAPDGARRNALFERIDRAIEPFDIAGLRDTSRRDWYPVLAGDLLANASKVQATAGEVEALLERCGLVSSTDSMNSAAGPTRNSA